jgi:hypothetical protein
VALGERVALVEAGAILGAALGREGRDPDRKRDEDESGHVLIIGRGKALL